MHNFGPAMVTEESTEQIVFGASRPGYGRQPVPPARVAAWLDFMGEQGIQRVCCLLSADQLGFYDDLLSDYRRFFGEERVCWAPVADFHLADAETLWSQILPFFADAEASGEPVAVHCSAGSGRTGHVLAAWLVFRYELTPQQAADAVVAAGRNPYEAEGRSDAGVAKLYELLAACRDADAP